MRLNIDKLIRSIESGDTELNLASVRVIQRYRHPAEFFTWTELGEALTPEEMLDLGLMPENVYEQIIRLQHENENVRSEGARALGNIRDPSAIPSLITLLQDENRYVRYWATEVLGSIGDPSAIPSLILALQDEAWLVRYWAAQALGKIGDPSAIPDLILALQDESGNVRFSAADALRKLGYES